MHTELSPVTSKQILSLTSEERTMLLDLVGFYCYEKEVSQYWSLSYATVHFSLSPSLPPSLPLSLSLSLSLSLPSLSPSLPLPPLSQFRELPMASSAHVFHRPAFSEANLLYSQILSKIGFGSSGGNLSYEADDVRCVDLIAVTITAIQATVGTP